MIGRWLLNLSLIAVLFVAGYWQYNKVNQGNVALCAQRVNLQGQVASSRKYLKDVKEGKRKPIQGITTADVLIGIKRQQLTIDAYSVLDC